MKSGYTLYDIEYEIALINYKQDQVIDLKRILSEFNVYEDIFNNTMSCELVLLDSIGLLERLPIIGDEKIVLQFKTTNEDENTELIFDVYKVSSRSIVEERAHAFVIHAVSSEGIVDPISKVDRAYVNQPISATVQQIYNQYLKPVGGKELEVESTDGPQSFVFYHNPFDALNLLASEAASTKYKNKSSFIFYENQDGFKFKTISSLLEQEPKENYYLGEINLDAIRDSQGEIKPYQTIIGINFEKTFDTLQALQMGMFLNAVDTIDPILKKFTSSDFNYKNDFQKLTHLGSKKIISDNGPISKGTNSAHTRFLSTQITNGDYKQESYLSGKISSGTDPFLASPRKRHKFLNNALSERAAFSQYTLNVTVAGNNLLKAGDIVNIFIPQNSDIEEDKQQYLKHFDQTNPKFLITAVRHNYKSTSGYYTTTINCIKESFDREIQSEYKSEDEQ